MMRKPENLEDPAQCVKYHRGYWWVFCVECDHWRQVMVMGMAVVFRKSWMDSFIVDKITSSLTFHCQHCHADIGYLLTKSQQDSINPN